MPEQPPYRSSMEKTWLDDNHPSEYEADGTRFLRCPTCEEWSPCRVRTAFTLANDAIEVVKGSVAWLDGNNLSHINEDRFLASIPAWWESDRAADNAPQVCFYCGKPLNASSPECGKPQLHVSAQERVHWPTCDHPDGACHEGICLEIKHPDGGAS